MISHVDPQTRLRNILSRALRDCSYESSRKEGNKALVLEARRSDGTHVGLRFLGLTRSETDAEPAPGEALRLRSVGGAGGSLWSLFLPRVLRVPSHSARVRIEAGKAKLEIVCEDVEWWED